MFDYRSTIAAVTCAGALLAACSDPDQPTDLRRDGPPNVTTVTVMSDLETAADPNPAGIGRIVETATFCRLNDEKRPGLVGLPDVRVIQVCPDDLKKAADEAGVAEAAPPDWFVRVVFDKLLDSSIEDLVPELDDMGAPTGITFGTLANTQPVTLTCGGTDVPYDGYYVPNGNRSSWPLGPALFIQPNDPLSVPTGTACTVAIKDNVHNKGGESVPTDQRSYQFQLAPMEFRFSNPDPSEGDNGDILQDPAASVDFFWTAALQKGTPVMSAGATITPSATLTASQVNIISGPNLNIGAGNPDGDADPAVCNGTGTAVPAAAIRVYMRSAAAASAATTQLVLRVDLKTSTTSPAWTPNTTYRITFATGAIVAAAQGGDGTFPADFSLCFHTSAP